VNRLPDFFPTKIHLRRFMNKYHSDKTFQKAFHALEYGTAQIDEYIARYLKPGDENFVVIQILGDEGSRKSGVGQYLASKYQRIKAAEDFSAEQIAMHWPEFPPLIPLSKPGWFALLDEQTRTHGTGSNRIRDDILNMKETLRQAEVSMIFISPTEKIFSVEDVHLTIEIVGYDGKYVLCFYKARSEIYLGSFVLTLEWNNPVWLDYMARQKRKYVEDAKNLNFKKSDYEAVALEVMANPKFQACTKVRERKLVLEELRPNLTIEEKKLIITKIGMIEAGNA
jgi:hypothetical protein